MSSEKKLYPRMLGSCKLLISLKLRYSAPDLIRWTASYCFNKGAFAQLREQNPRYPTEIGTFLLRPCNRGRQHTAQAQFFVPVSLVWFVFISMLKLFSSKNIEYKYSKSRNYYRNAIHFLEVLVRI